MNFCIDPILLIILKQMSTCVSIRNVAIEPFLHTIHTKKKEEKCNQDYKELYLFPSCILSYSKAENR